MKRHFFDFQWDHLFEIRKRHSILKKSFRTQHFSRNYFYDFKKSRQKGRPWMKNLLCVFARVFETQTTTKFKNKTLYQRNLSHPLSLSLSSTLALSHFSLSPREVLGWEPEIFAANISGCHLNCNWPGNFQKHKMNKNKTMLNVENKYFCENWKHKIKMKKTKKMCTVLKFKLEPGLYQNFLKKLNQKCQQAQWVSNLIILTFIWKRCCKVYLSHIYYFISVNHIFCVLYS